MEAANCNNQSRWSIFVALLFSYFTVIYIFIVQFPISLNFTGICLLISLFLCSLVCRVTSLHVHVNMICCIFIDKGERTHTHTLRGEGDLTFGNTSHLITSVYPYYKFTRVTFVKRTHVNCKKGAACGVSLKCAPLVKRHKMNKTNTYITIHIEHFCENKTHCIFNCALGIIITGVYTDARWLWPLLSMSRCSFSCFLFNI